MLQFRQFDVRQRLNKNLAFAGTFKVTAQIAALGNWSVTAKPGPARQACTASRDSTATAPVHTRRAALAAGEPTRVTLAFGPDGHPCVTCSRPGTWRGTHMEWTRTAAPRVFRRLVPQYWQPRQGMELMCITIGWSSAG